MCSKRWANPVRPGFSCLLPTSYHRLTATIGALSSTDRTTRRPLSSSCRWIETSGKARSFAGAGAGFRRLPRTDERAPDGDWHGLCVTVWLMKIAQVAPLAESVPPQLYGGTERIVSYLTEELVRAGHDVTLFASGDSVTSARLVAVTPRALRLDPDVIDPLAHSMVLLERISAEAQRYDVIHFHFDHVQFAYMRRLDVPSLATMHGRMDLPDLVPLFREYSDVPLVSISDAQREPLPDLNWLATIYHGLPMEEIPVYPESGSYLAFLGRISPEKRLDRAIEIAQGAGLPL